MATSCTPLRNQRRCPHTDRKNRTLRPIFFGWKQQFIKYCTEYCLSVCAFRKRYRAYSVSSCVRENPPLRQQRQQQRAAAAATSTTMVIQRRRRRRRVRQRCYKVRKSTKNHITVARKCGTTTATATHRAHNTPHAQQTYSHTHIIRLQIYTHMYVCVCASVCRLVECSDGGSALCPVMIITQMLWHVWDLCLGWL